MRRPYPTPLPAAGQHRLVHLGWPLYPALADDDGYRAAATETTPPRPGELPTRPLRRRLCRPRHRRAGSRPGVTRRGRDGPSPDGSAAVTGEDPSGPHRRRLRFPRLQHPRDAETWKPEALRLHPALGQGDRLDQGTGSDPDLQTHPAPRPRLLDGVPGSGAAWLGELLPPRCLQSRLQRGRLLHLGANHVLAAEEAPDRTAGTAAQVLPARHLAPGSRRATVPWRRHRHGHAIPLPRIPHPDPVDTINHTPVGGSSIPWRARCGESRTAGSAGGPGKRNSGNAVTAPRADPTGTTSARSRSTTAGADRRNSPAWWTCPVTSTDASAPACSTSSRAAQGAPTGTG